MSLGREIDLVGHQRLSVDPIQASLLPSIDNIVIKTEREDLKWIEETTSKIGDWRAYFRSVYIRWALTINGLHLAQEKYSTSKENKNFIVRSLRMNNGKLDVATIAEWDFETAAESHIKTIPMLTSYGLIDLYGCFEEFVFDFFRIFITHNPKLLLSGDENKPLRRFYKEYLNNVALKDDWEKKFQERLNAWQRKRLYDSLGKVFLSYCTETKIKAPSFYKNTTPETWAASLTGIGLVRHSLIHGSKTVSKELADFCALPWNCGFTFKENDKLEITLFHLQAVEMFSHQLLTALNASLVDLIKNSPPENNTTQTMY